MFATLAQTSRVNEEPVLTTSLNCVLILFRYVSGTGPSPPLLTSIKVLRVSYFARTANARFVPKIRKTLLARLCDVF